MMPTVPPIAGARVSARDWCWRYGSRARPTFTGLDLTIEPGERVLLLGASGSGKSTLVAGLAGVLGDDEGHESGELLLDGQPSRFARGRVGLVLQDPENQVILHRVGDDVAFGCENLGVPQGEIWDRVHASLDAVGLNVPLDRSTSELSGGQKQRLALAGVLAMRPGLIVLDEPTANLDPDGVREIRRAVETVATETGATLLIVEHRVDIWWDLVTRVIVLDSDGSILRDGPPADVLDSARARLTEAGIWLPRQDPSEGRGHINHDQTSPSERASFPLVSPPPLLRASDLSVGRAGSTFPAASPLTLALNAGTVHAIVGPNGAGKSTLALTLAGLLPALSGELSASEELTAGIRTRSRTGFWPRVWPGASSRASAADNTERQTEPITWRSRELLTRIGMVFQSPEHQFLTGSVRDELLVGPRALSRGDSDPQDTAHQRRADELLERLHLAHLAAAHPFTLSGGEKRRLSVATALATAPRVLILDEPTFGQDARTWVELVTLFAELRNEGHAIVTVTHDERLVERLADVQTRLESQVEVVR
jgi:energy-coupling factor transporter ATP-binding protein EcfA2